MVASQRFRRALPISADAVSFFRANGYVLLRDVVSPESIEKITKAIIGLQGSRDSGEIARAKPDHNVWQRSQAIYDFIFCGQLGAIGSQLLGCSGTRLIHDAVFVKNGCSKATPWHRDSDFWSFEGKGALTAWIPLQPTTASMALRYVPGSHRQNSRLLRKYEKALVSLKCQVANEPLALGDVAIHHFQTLHGSMQYSGPVVRRSLAIHMIDADAHVGQASNEFQNSHNMSCQWNTLRTGERFPDDIAPRLYSSPTLHRA